MRKRPGVARPPERLRLIAATVLGEGAAAPAGRAADLEARLERLRLHWVTFDALFEGMPESELASAVRSFSRRFDGTGLAFEPSIEEPMAWILRNLENFSSEKFDNSERS